MNGIKAILLGAGASCELAMPLVWELTEEIKNFLSPEKLRGFDYNWKKAKLGHLEDTINFVCNLLNSNNLHYEDIIGAIEVEIKRTHGNNEKYQDLHGMKQWLLQYIYFLFYYRQTKNYQYIRERMILYEGFEKIASISKPLWIYSLNHDLITEMMAYEFQIPLKTGFNDYFDINYLYKGNKKTLKCEYISREDINNNKLDFHKVNEEGINLLKLHGSLDIFGESDDLNLIKLLPKEKSSLSILQSLVEINENVHYISNNVNTTNEVMYLDHDNELQFLRRSIISGAYKFKNKEIAPKEFLDSFKSNLNCADTFLLIGYSFSDNHINEIIHNWLVFSKERKIEIVNPSPIIPSSFIHLSSQIKVIKMSFSDYLISLLDSDEKKRIQKTRNKYKRLHNFAKSRLGKLIGKLLKRYINSINLKYGRTKP